MKFMRLMVMFDLPTGTKKERKAYTLFRKFLIKEGFEMMQFSVYVRICRGADMALAYEDRIRRNIPPKGHVRSLVLTNSQYERMHILLGGPKSQEKIGAKQLVLF
ncbi:conserved hypothetical protein [Wolinella succinogenes]|uniref:CRISPR-associated endoribonuclease Cas2 n=2 Tax=Wolinella succinogenes TaxID=844 RepID=Q7MRD5_WOLSU|nr:conserved hypothetical protein [Wolinella succinogenes]